MESVASHRCKARTFCVCTGVVIAFLLIHCYYTPKQIIESITQPKFDKSDFKNMSKKADQVKKVEAIQESMFGKSRFNHHSLKAEEDIPSTGYYNGDEDNSVCGYMPPGDWLRAILCTSVGSCKVDAWLQNSREECKQDDFFLEMEIKQEKRILHFRQKCESFGYGGTLSREVTLFRAKKYNLAWKRIPKIGSTFLINVFKILNNQASEDVFQKPRHIIHSPDGGKNEGVVNVKTIQKQTILIMARNPFSRLFSAYIDKDFLFNNFELSRQIYLRKTPETSSAAKGQVCCFNNTFDEFLSYVLDTSIDHVLFEHYRPLLSNRNILDICKYPNIIIVKQESFSDDVEYALRQTGVEKKKFNIIHAAMHEKKVQSTIPGIVKTVYEKMSKRNKIIKISENCLFWPIIAEKVWKSFQIQGHISKNSEFPAEKFSIENNYTNPNSLINLILSEANKYPLTHEESVEQRTKYLLNAYSAVNQSIKLKIEKMYALDFNFFGYSREVENVNS